MFESITKSSQTTGAKYRMAKWAAVSATLLGSAAVILAQASSPFLVFASLALLTWLPLFYALMQFSSQIVDEEVRLGVQSLLCAVFFAPSIIGGEGGVALAPAIVVVFLPGHFFRGALPLIFVGAIAFVVLSSRLR